MENSGKNTMQVLGITIRNDKINIKTDNGCIEISLEYKANRELNTSSSKKFEIVLQTDDCIEIYDGEWCCKYGDKPIIIGNCINLIEKIVIPPPKNDCEYCNHKWNCIFCGYNQNGKYNHKLAEKLLYNKIFMKENPIKQYGNTIDLEFCTIDNKIYNIIAFVIEPYWSDGYPGDISFNIIYPGFNQKITIPKRKV
jgi:hypothetical protein